MTTKLIEHEGWTLRIRQPEVSGPYPIVFLLHGWKGTEDVMWVFAGKLPANALVFAPRAPYLASSGYSWVDEKRAGLSSIDQFTPSIRSLEELVRSLGQLYYGDFSKLHLMGFSQGAAMSFAWAANHPQQIQSLAGLAGFVPGGFIQKIGSNSLPKVPVFLAHGSQDDTVPLSVMRSGAAEVEKTGAELTICIDDVGHKLSSNCMQALGHFYDKVFPKNK